MDLGLSGKKAIVTGGTRGIGRAVAGLLAHEGCGVAICARGAEGVAATVEQLRATGVTAYGGVLNARDGDAMRQWIGEASDSLGGLDILVASLSAGGGMDSERNWHRNFEIDVMSTVRAVETALPHLKKSTAGSVVIIGTMAASETFVGPMAYNAMKAALVTYSKQLSQLLAKRGIRVNCVSPGPTVFEGSAWEMVQVANKKLYASTLRQQPQRRMANVEEIARSVVFVASPAASWLCGSHLLVDGGFSKRVQF
jgi:3-oxoacyl-[acyl-carrier protein] reductase